MRDRSPRYQRWAAVNYRDHRASLQPRQGVFYRNLIRLAVERKSRVIPVDFELRDGTPKFLDRGCIKIAEHARFIEPLRDDYTGTVSTIRLAWG